MTSLSNDQSRREIHVTILVMVALTLIAFAENHKVVPWSPLMITYGSLALILPMKFRRRDQLGLKQANSWKRASLLIGVALIMYYALVTLFFQAYYSLLASLGLTGNPSYDYGVAQKQTMTVAVEKSPFFDLKRLYPLGLLGWAPVAEELLYRGYFFQTLLRARSFFVAATVSSCFFALRHAFQFLVLPETPVFAGLFWFTYVLPFGYIACYLLKRCDSIYPSIILHFLVNLLGYMEFK